MPDSGVPFETGVLVGPSGAEVALPSGGSVTIPAGALSTDVVIGVSEVTDLPPLPAGHVQSGTALAFTPHGLTFALPVTLSVPYTGNASRVVRLDDLQDRSWEFVDNGVFSGGVITLSATHFSVYLGVRRTTGTITLDGGSGSGGMGGGTGGSGGTSDSGGASGGSGTGAVGGTAGDSVDAAVDAGTMATDSGVDASYDASYDAGTNIGDAGISRDAGTDAGYDAGTNIDDAGNDAAACGRGCGTGEVCDAGICECAPESWCAIDYGYDAGSPEYQCVDTQTDPYNCGGCSNVCYQGEQCVQGQCAPAACQTNEVRCNGSCTDVGSDAFNCGGCGVVCDVRAGELCGAGSCYQGT